MYFIYVGKEEIVKTEKDGNGEEEGMRVRNQS